MPSEVIRCSDCGAIFKGVPSWLIGAKVKFTCTNCPKRPSRAAPRFDGPLAPPVAVMDPEKDLGLALASGIDEDSEDEADLDLAAEDLSVDDLDDLKEEK